MSEQELRELIETNFRLVGMSLREVAGRFGTMDEEMGTIRGGLDSVRVGLEEVARKVDSLGEEVGSLGEEVGSLRELAQANQASLVETADRLDQTLDALKVLAFSDVDSKARLQKIETRLESVEARLDKLDLAS